MIRYVLIGSYLMYMNFAAKKCIPCEAGTLPMGTEEVRAALLQIPGWELMEEKKIRREWKFKDFSEAMAFVDRAAELAEQEGHHPDILIHNWNRVRLELTTHAIKGLSENDFIVAAKINALTL